MSEKEPTAKEGKGLDDDIICCPFCQTEWTEKDQTNKKILCECGKTFKVIRYS